MNTEVSGNIATDFCCARL